MHLDWLADAAARQILNRARLRADGPLHRMNEATAVSLLESIFTGLGYITSREIPFPGTTQKRIDLVAELPGLEWWIEAKVIWDGEDARLNRNRFLGESKPGREILGDLDRLVASKSLAQCVGIWFAFSKSPEIISAGEAATLRLGDALRLAQECGVSLNGRCLLTLDERTEWRYGNILCFAPI